MTGTTYIVHTPKSAPAMAADALRTLQSDPPTLQAFFAAGSIEAAGARDVVMGMAFSVMANYASHLTRPPPTVFWQRTFGRAEVVPSRTYLRGNCASASRRHNEGHGARTRTQSGTSCARRIAAVLAPCQELEPAGPRTRGRSVSPRRLCFLETGRAKPSRDMVLLLADALAVPLRERNALLLAAGFAPMFRESTLDDRELVSVRTAIHAILKQQEPYPAVVMNRHWDILANNTAATRFFGMLLDGRTPKGAGNILRLCCPRKAYARSSKTGRRWRSPWSVACTAKRSAARSTMRDEGCWPKCSTTPACPQTGARPIWKHL